MYKKRHFFRIRVREIDDYSMRSVRLKQYTIRNGIREILLRNSARFQQGRSWTSVNRCHREATDGSAAPPTPAHMCKDGCPRSRIVGAFVHVRISLSRSQCRIFVAIRRCLKNRHANTCDSRGEERIYADDLVTVSNDLWRNDSIFFFGLGTVRFSPASAFV